MVGLTRASCFRPRRTPHDVCLADDSKRAPHCLPAIPHLRHSRQLHPADLTKNREAQFRQLIGPKKRGRSGLRQASRGIAAVVERAAVGAQLVRDQRKGRHAVCLFLNKSLHCRLLLIEDSVHLSNAVRIQEHRDRPRNTGFTARPSHPRNSFVLK